MQTQLRVLVRPLANAKRDADNGMGLAATLDTVKQSLCAKKATLDYNVLVLTEFGRGLTQMQYDDFIGFVDNELGLGRHLGFKKDRPFEEQDNGTEHPIGQHMETIVFTSIPDVPMTRVLLSEAPATARDRSRVNGAITMQFGVTLFVAYHGTLLLGTSDKRFKKLVTCELQQLRRMERDKELLVVGDFNMTDALVARLDRKMRKAADQRTTDLLDKRTQNIIKSYMDYAATAYVTWALNYLTIDARQPDFVCTPHDRIPERFLVHSDNMHMFDRDAENGTVRIVSSLGKRSRGWDTARYFHPVVDEADITGVTHQQVADMIPPDAHWVFDHAACFVTKGVETPVASIPRSLGMLHTSPRMPSNGGQGKSFMSTTLGMANSHVHGIIDPRLPHITNQSDCLSHNFADRLYYPPGTGPEPWRPRVPLNDNDTPVPNVELMDDD